MRSVPSWPAEVSYHPLDLQWKQPRHLRSTWRRPPYMSWISWWKKNTSGNWGQRKRASCLSWGPQQHTFHRSDPNVSHVLTEPFTPSPLLVLPALSVPMPSCPLSIPDLVSKVSLCMATEGRSNDFLLLMRQGVSVLCSSVELQQIKRAFIGLEASAATPKCHRGI